jgi:hypothetical protein
MIVLFPNMSPSLPRIGVETAATSSGIVRTHATALVETPKLSWIVGIAGETAVWKNALEKTVSERLARISR